MKRGILILLCLLLVWSLAGCGDKPVPETPGDSGTPGGESGVPGSTQPEQTEEGPGPAQTLGALAENGYSLYIEAGTFGDRARVSLQPDAGAVPETDKYEIIGTPLSVSCDQYDGSFFGTDVILTLPLPEGDGELSRFVFVTAEEDGGEPRYLFPDHYDTAAGTMSIALPHFSSWWGGKLSQEEQIEAFLDSYCTKQAVANGEKQQAASELEPYVRAKAEALGLTKQAAEDLVQSTVNYLGGQVGGKYGGAAETGTKAITAIVRGVYDEDPEAARNGLEDAVNGAMSHCWEDLKFSERLGEVTGSEALGGSAGAAVGNARGLGAMAGYLAEGDTKGAMQELGNMLQNVHPAAEFATKGAAFLASSANMAFTNWKSNQVEELFKVYRDGKEQGFFGNEVVARDKSSFLTYLNTASGFTLSKGVKRFYNLDNIEEVCERYGWDFKSYSELPERYREIFEQRAEESLLAYFELRIQQEAEAEKLKQTEREAIETMLRDYGALKEGRFTKFFGEESSDDYDLSRRLERLVKVRSFLTQYVDQKAMNQSIKDGGFNWGDVINWWVGYADEYPKDQAIDKLIADLEQYELLNPDFVPPAKPELAELVGDFAGDLRITKINISEEAFQAFKASVAEGVDLGEFGVAEAGSDLKNMTQAECDEMLNAMVAEGGFGLLGQLGVSSDDPNSGSCLLRFTFYQSDEEDYEEQEIPVSAAYADGVFTLQAPHSGSLTATLEEGLLSIQGSGIRIAVADEEEGMVVFHCTVDLAVSRDK